MRKIKTTLLGITAAICLCVCAVVIFHAVRPKPAANVKLDDGIVFYCDLDSGSGYRITVPTNDAYGGINCLVLKDTSGGIERHRKFYCGVNPPSVTFDVPRSGDVFSQDYYVCLTSDYVYQNEFDGWLDDALEGVTPGEDGQIKVKVNNSDLTFNKLTVKYIHDPIMVTNVKIGGTNIATAPIITDTVDVEFEVTSYNPIDSSEFENTNSDGSCKGIFSYDGKITKSGVSVSREGDGPYKYTVTGKFEPNNECYNLSSEIFLKIDDKVGVHVDKKLSDMAGQDNPGVGTGKIKVDKCNVSGSFSGSSESDLSWTNASEVKLKLTLTENSNNNIGYLSKLQQDDLSISNMEAFNGSKPGLKLVKTDDEVYAEILVTCAEDEYIENPIDVKLSINRDGIQLDKTYTTNNPVLIDRIPPKIEPEENSFTHWSKEQVNLVYKVTEDNSKLARTGSANDSKTDVQTDSSPNAKGEGYYSYTVQVPDSGVLEKTSVTLMAIDNAGNTTTVELKDIDVLIDKAAPVVTVEDARTYNPGSTDPLKPGDEKFDLKSEWIREPVKIKLNINDMGVGVSDSTINEKLCILEDNTVGLSVGKHYDKDKDGHITGVYLILNPARKIAGGLDPTYSGDITIYLEDDLGNHSENNKIHVNIDNRAPEIKEVTFTKVGDESAEYVGENDKVRVTVRTNDGGGSGANTAKIKFEGKKETVTLTPKADGDDVLFVGDISVNWLEDNKPLIMTSLIVTDNAGNKYTSRTDTRENTGLTYYAPMDIDSIGFNYNNNKMLVKEGDTIRFSFKPEHIMKDTDNKGTLAIGDKNIELEWTYDEEKNEFSTEYKVEGLQAQDNKEFDLNIVLHDQAGNELKIDQSVFNNKIKYFAPIEARDLSLKVNGGDKRYVRNGDTLNISFRVDHPVKVSNSKISGKDVELKTSDGYVYSGELKLEDGMISDNTDITYGFELSDEAGNAVYRADQSKTGPVTYYAPINVHDIKMTTNNDGTSNTGAKNGDTVTVTFVTDHPAEVKEASIGGQDIGFNSDDRMNWSGTVDAKEGMTSDMGYIPLRIVVGDEAGNDDVRKTENDLSSQKVTYVAPINISGVSMESNNAKDPNRSAKSGDTVKVTFTANHNVNVTNAKIGGKDANITVSEAGGETRKYELTCSFTDEELADQAQIHFSFDASDMAGNAPAVISDGSLGTNVLTYYAPIKSEVTIASNGRNTSYVKNGGKIIITGEANHPVQPEKAKIMGRTAEGTSYMKTDYSVAYDIPEDEVRLAQTEATFEYTLTDAAGNELKISKVTDKSKVLYDRTLPIIEADYDKVNFTNDTVEYLFTFSDENLSGADLSIKINGEEQITDEERSSFKGTYFVKEIAVDADDNYKIVASAFDLAGNEGQPCVINMTVDKTAPKLKTVSISSNKPEIFSGSFSIKDHLEIDEANLKEIICTVTNATGTTDWDINEPITTEGKNTIYIVATDMANNTSPAITYDIYIDTTPPKPVVSERKRDLFIYPDKEAVFSEQAEFDISLEPLHIEGISQPDHFTKLCITDREGKVIVDLLEGGFESKEERGVYTVTISDKGEYYLVLEAEDDVGNKTGEVKYIFRIDDKNVIQKMTDNKLAVAGIATCGAVIAIASGYVLVFRRVRRKRLG